VSRNGRNGVGAQLRLPGISWKVRNPGRKAPELSTFKLPAMSTDKFEADPDDQFHVTIADADGNVIMGYYLRCDFVGFRRHHPVKGHAWTERIHQLGISE
jgi:hypothetical protein